MSALRSCIEPTTRRSSSPAWPISRSTSACGMTPMTSPPAAQRRVGQRAHHPDAARRRRRARMPRCAERARRRPRRPPRRRVGAGVRAAEDADRGQLGHAPSICRRRARVTGQAATGVAAASPRRAASACSRLSREEISTAARIAPTSAKPAPTRNASWKPSVSATARSRTPAAISRRRAAVGDRGEDRQAERAADLLGRVDQPRREARLVGPRCPSPRRSSPARTRSRARRRRAATGTARRRRTCRRAPRPARTRAARRRCSSMPTISTGLKPKRVDQRGGAARAER